MMGIRATRERGNRRLRRRNLIHPIATLLVLALVAASPSWAQDSDRTESVTPAAPAKVTGNPDSPGPPESTLSFNLMDIYLRLSTGEPGAQSVFTEPTSGPGTPTMATLDQIMAAAPTADNAGGATPGDVLAGRTFWSLRTDGSGGSVWGPSVGSIPIRTVDPNTVAQQAGLYDAFDLSVVDPDLNAGNIRSGATVYGITGTWDGSIRVVSGHGTANPGGSVYVSATCPAGWTRSDWSCGVKGGVIQGADITVDLHCFISFQKCECTVWNNEAFALEAALVMVCD